MALSPSEAAIDRAAAMLRASRFPVFAGLRCDVAGIAAAIRLAERLGGAVDHAGAEAVLRDAAVLHDRGLMLVSPSEARQRADTVLVVGDAPLEAWPELAEFLLGGASERVPARRMLALCGREPADRFAGELRWVAADADALPGLLGAVRARLDGRPLAAGAGEAGDADAAAAFLKEARFGVAIWNPSEIDALAIEMLAGLVKDLNAETRFSGLSVADDPSAAAAVMVAGWTAGLPIRLGFGGSEPQHDPWRFEARRLLAEGEADLLVWIDACGAPLPEWVADAPAIVLSSAEIPVAAGALSLPVGEPGADHDGVLYDRRSGTLSAKAAAAPSDRPSVAAVLGRIAERCGAT